MRTNDICTSIWNDIAAIEGHSLRFTHFNPEPWITTMKLKLKLVQCGVITHRRRLKARVCEELSPEHPHNVVLEVKCYCQRSLRKKNHFLYYKQTTENPPPPYTHKHTEYLIFWNESQSKYDHAHWSNTLFYQG